MRKPILIGMASLALPAVLAGCGLESFIGNVTHDAFDRPASTIRGHVGWDARPSQFTVTDGDGNKVAAFLTTVKNGVYEVRLPSSKYSMVTVHGRAGDMELRALVPFIDEESAVDGVDLDARAMTEALIFEANVSARALKVKKLTPAAYVGDGVSTGTRTLIGKALDQPGPAQDLLRMVERLMTQANPKAGVPSPFFFITPVLDATFAVTQSPLDAGWLARNPFDYTGSGCGGAPLCSDSAAFDAALAAAAPPWRPEGCPDPDHIRLMFTVDFNAGCLDGNGGAINRFKWATDKPGKSVFFVGWIYTNTPPGASAVQDPTINDLVGGGVPNQIPMYDDGTNGDEVAGDGIWTAYFDVPYDPAHLLRLGYKYTWGTRGAVWTGSEEWPGNSRMLEVVDENGDGIVYRRDVFGDEATNKDKMNLNYGGTGSIGWTTDLRGCGPESHEQKVTLHNAQTCETWITPQSVGSINVACTQ